MSLWKPQPGEVAYGLYTGDCYEAQVRTKNEATRSARRLSAYRKMPCRIVRQVAAPDGSPRITQPGFSTWYPSLCTSEFWVDDPEYTLIFNQPKMTYNGAYQTQQEWHAKYVRGDWERGGPKDLQGFRVHCEKEHHRLHRSALNADTPGEDSFCQATNPAGVVLRWQPHLLILETVQAAWKEPGPLAQVG